LIFPKTCSIDLHSLIERSPSPPYIGEGNLESPLMIALPTSLGHVMILYC
jgi:hypothetical protein